MSDSTFRPYAPKGGIVLAAYFDGLAETAGNITRETSGAVYLDTLNPGNDARLISFSPFPGKPSAIPSGWWVICEVVKDQALYYGMEPREFAARYKTDA